jgi:hypothetical protein
MYSVQYGCRSQQWRRSGMQTQTRLNPHDNCWVPQTGGKAETMESFEFCPPDDRSIASCAALVCFPVIRTPCSISYSLYYLPLESVQCSWFGSVCFVRRWSAIDATTKEKEKVVHDKPESVSIYFFGWHSLWSQKRSACCILKPRCTIQEETSKIKHITKVND